MKYIPREAVGKIQQQARKFPIVSITGPRQSGKSTIAKHAFPSYGYVLLEDPNMRMFALEDPLGFLGTYPGEVIIDEAQRAPELFSYLQGRVDESGLPGQYVEIQFHRASRIPNSSNILPPASAARLVSGDDQTGTCREARRYPEKEGSRPQHLAQRRLQRFLAWQSQSKPHVVEVESR